MRQEAKNRSIVLFLLVQTILFSFLLTLSQLSGNIQSYFQNNMDQMLGADVVLTQDRPFSDQAMKKFEQWNAKLVETSHLTLVTNFKDNWQKVKIKAVNSDYIYSLFLA